MPRMRRYRSLPLLAVRRMSRNWRLLLSVVAGTLVAAAILSATAVYADAIRDLGLRYAIGQRDPRTLDVSVLQSNVPVSATRNADTRRRQDSTVVSILRDAAAGVVRQGTTATLFPSAPGTPAGTAQDRPRANLVFRTDLDPHIEIVEGAAPAPVAGRSDAPIEVLVGRETAEAGGLSVGQELDLAPFWAPDAPPLRVRITGIAVERDPAERYWGTSGAHLDAEARNWVTYRLFVPEATFFGGLPATLPSVTADYHTRYEVDLDVLNARRALPVANGLDTLAQRLNAADERVTVEGALSPVLRTFDEKLFFTRIPLLVLLLQVGGIVAYYLVMVSTMLIERQAAEIATMRSRGATTPQLLAMYGVEGALLAALATLAGPPLAGLIIGALGPTPAFSALSGGGALDVHIGGAAYFLAIIGALIAFFALMVPAWFATRDTVVEFKRGVARPKPVPLLLRYYVDVVFVLVVAAVFWRVSQQEGLVSESIFGEAQVDPFLLATPAVFMLTVGIVFLRVFPLVLRLVAWVLGWTRSVAILAGMRALVRNPTHYTRLVLLLMFATGVGMFGATFSATLSHSYEDRALYVSGADVRAVGLVPPAFQGDAAVRAAIEGVPAEATSVVVRATGFGYAGRETADLAILGVDPATFGEVAYFRDDFAPESLDTMLTTLAGEGPVAGAAGALLPEDARQIGIWAQFPDIRGRVVLGLSLRDATGRVSHRQVGVTRPDHPSSTSWVLFAADLDAPRSRAGANSNEPALVAPVELLGVWFIPSGRIASQRGVVLFGPAVTTASAPVETSEVQGLVERPKAWPDATTVHDFTQPGFDVVRNLTQIPVGDQTRNEPNGPPGALGALRFEWVDAAGAPSFRGLAASYLATPVPAYLSSREASKLGLVTGDTFRASISGRYLDLTLAGVLDYFPTFEPNGRGGIALVDSSRLLATVNASLPDRWLLANEAWFASDTPGATAAALEPLQPREVVQRAAVQATQQEDPLVAAGWAGILAISFGAVLLLSAIGFIVYSYLTAQQRGLEFAILRTLGFSRVQVFGVVLFEHLFVIAAGMGLGTGVGLRLGRMMLGLLATDERGTAVLPPLQLRVSWVEVVAVWGILGAVFIATIAAVVALYFRLAVHRVLRIGDA
jgi:hypothetical protein